MLKKLKDKIDWFLILTFAAGLAPLLWFKRGLGIAGGDESWIINPRGFYPDVSYSWNDKIFNFGGPNIYLPYTRTLLPFWDSLTALQLPNVLIEKVWIILLFALPGVSMYVLAKYWLSKGKPSLAGIAAAILYMFNLYVIVIGPYQTNTRLMLAALPLCLLFMIKGLESKKFFIGYAIFLALAMSLIGTAFVNIAVIAPIPIVLLAYLAYCLVYKKYPLGRIFGFFLLAVGIWLLLNINWIYPYLKNMLAFNSTSGSATFSFVQLDTKQLYNFWRFLGSWAWMDTHNKQLYYPFAVNYKFFPLVYISYFISAIALLGAFFYRKKREATFLIVLAFAGLMLAKGSSQPIGSWYAELFRHFKFLWIFREPWAKFTPVFLFAMSLLYGLAVDKIASFYKKLRFFIAFIFIGLVLVNGYPLLSKVVIWDKTNGSMRTNFVEIPWYWQEMENYISSNTGPFERILLMPPSGYAVGYSWDHGFFAGDTPAIVLLNRNTIKYTSFPTTPSDTLINKMYEDLVDNPEKLKQYMATFSANYILLDGDIDYDISEYSKDSPKALRNASGYASVIKKSKDLKLIHAAGSLELYELKNHSQSTMIKISSSGGQPDYHFVKISSSEYKVEIINGLSPFSLILNNNFNSLWRAKVCRKDSCTTIRNEDHTMIDGYKNSWYINEKGDYTITLEYLNQPLVRKLKLISYVTFLVITGYLIFLISRRRKYFLKVR